MIIWRGWGLLVILFAIIGLGPFAALNWGLVLWLKDVQFPGNPYGSDLFVAYNPYVVGLCVGAGGAIAAALCWFVGNDRHRDGNRDSFLFVGLRWWSVVFGFLAFSNLVSGFIPRFGFDGYERSFDRACAQYERGASDRQCACMGRRIAAGSSPMAFVPFFVEAKDFLRARVDGDAAAVSSRFFDNYLPSLSPETQTSFGDALKQGVACLDDPIREGR